MLCLLSGPASVPHEFGFLFSLHSFEHPFLFRTLICLVASIYPVKVAVQFLWTFWRSTASASPLSAAPRPLLDLPLWLCSLELLLSCSFRGWEVRLCKDQTLLADPCLARVPQKVHIGVDLRWLGYFVANFAVASSAFFVPPFVYGLLRTLHISPPPHTALTDFLVALCRGEMPVGLGGDLR